MDEIKKYEQVFQHHAKDRNGIQRLDVDGFLEAVAPAVNYNQAINGFRISRETYKVLFNVADTKKQGFLELHDWMKLMDILRRPDAEFQIAFKVFDTDRTGQISLDNFQKVYFQNKPPNSQPFDFSTLFTRLYFGKGKVVPYDSFCQMLNDFSFERAKQMFRRFDPENSGFISISDFQKMVSTIGRYKLSKEFMDRAGEIAGHASSGDNGVSYSTVNAFFNIIRRAELVRFTAKKCANSEGYFSRQHFAQALAATLDWQVPSPLEIDLLFYFAGVTVSGNVGSLDAFDNLFDPLWEDKKIFFQRPKTSLTNEVQNSAKSFALGCIAGAVGASAVYPIDLVKTRMQRQRKSIEHPVLYKNSIQCLRSLLKNEGFLGLYSGLKPQLVGVAPEKAIKLAVNDFVREFFREDNGKVPRFAEVLAGATAGAFQVVFTNPVEIIKIRLQVQGDKTYASSSTSGGKTAMKIIQELGLPGLYKGFQACLLRDVLFSSIYFPVYYKLKMDYFGERPGHHTSITENLIAGATAAIPAAFVTTPCDVVKTRIQVKPGPGETPYKGVIDAAFKIYKEEGMKAFFKGGPARILRSAPQFGITLATYEFLKKLMPTKPTEIAKVTNIPEPMTNNSLKLLLNIDENFGRTLG